MVDIEKAKKEFGDYTCQYDIKNISIIRKIEHSIRVMEICKKLANILKLDEEKVKLAELIGLLHDIARFEQYTRYKTFKDDMSINHGELGVEILEDDEYIRKYIEENQYDEIIKKSIRNHNAYKLEEGLNEEEILFCNIIRDSDKIDILYQIGEIFKHWEEEYSGEEKISSKVLNQFYNGELIKNEFKKTKLDAAIGVVSFIYDFNLKESFVIIKEKDYINNIIDEFEIKDETVKKQMDKIIKIANEYINEKTK